MKLLTKAIINKLPALYAQEDMGDDAIVHVKFFTPSAGATWYITEYDGKDTFFGLADLGMGCQELGYISKSELEAIKLPMGLSVERDMYFTPKTLGEIKARF